MCGVVFLLTVLFFKLLVLVPQQVEGGSLMLSGGVVVRCSSSKGDWCVSTSRCSKDVSWWWLSEICIARNISVPRSSWSKCQPGLRKKKRNQTKRPSKPSQKINTLTHPLILFLAQGTERGSRNSHSREDNTSRCLYSAEPSLVLWWELPVWLMSPPAFQSASSKYHCKGIISHSVFRFFWDWMFDFFDHEITLLI